MQRHSFPIALVAIVLVVLYGVVTWRFVARHTATPIPRSPYAAIAKTSSLSSTATSSVSVSSTSDTIAQVKSIVPNPDLIVDVQRMRDRIYWVRQRMTDAASSHGENDRTWIVDLGTGKATQLGDLNFGYPGASATTSVAQRYFVIHWDSGWETGFRKRTDYLDLQTGTLAMALESKSDIDLSVIHGDQLLRIQLAPTNRCGDQKTVTLTGMLINDHTIPFSKKRTVACVTNDLTGEAVSPSFKRFDLDEDRNVIQIGMPWNEVYEIPADTLDIAKAKFY